MDKNHTAPSFNNGYFFRAGNNYFFWSGGFIGLYSVINVFSELGSLKYYIYIGIPLIFIMFLLGFYWRNLKIGKILTSSAIYLWFLLGFFMLRVADINLLK